MKKILITLLAIMMSMAFMCGCGDTSTEPMTDDTASVEEQVEEEVIKDDSSSWTTEQKNAYRAGLNYLSFMPFSKAGLINQLSSEYGDKYPQEVAEFAVNKIEERGEVDWIEQAKKAAENYMDLMPFSKDELINQLCSDAGDKYTREQAEKAVDAVYK